jgi:sigma-E factor negative regulatory protein RseC
MNAPMLEREGRVVAVDGGRLTLRFERASACGACRAAKVCSGNTPTRDLVLPLPSGAAPRPGDLLWVGVSESAALRATALAYLAPLAGLLGAMGAAALAGLPDGAIAAVSFAGLAAGYAALHRLAGHAAHALRPVVLDAARRAPPLS